MQKISIRHLSRTRWLQLAVLLLMAIFVLRLFYIQVIRHDFYEKEAYNSQVTKLTIQPNRGKIYAMDGKTPTPLVLNESVYTVFADPQEVKDPDKIASTIRRIAGGNAVDSFEDGLKSTHLRYVVLARQVTRTQAELIKKEDLSGVGFQEGDRRVYPEGNLAAQLLGYVDTEGKGEYGLEGQLNDRLKGTPGLLQSVTDVRRIPLTIGKDDVRELAKDGDNLVLNIDRNIQAQAEQVLKSGLDKAHATTGSILVMDPNSGAIMAMANFPTYDPAKYNEVDDYSVFQNSVVTSPYEAGSVVKTLTMGAGIDSGAVNYNSTYNNTGKVQVDDTTISNVEEDPIFPNTSMTDVLQYSLNTGVVYVLQQMGGGEVNQKARETLYDYFANHYRLGKKTGVDQAGEAAGTIIGPNEGYGRNVRYADMTFGQGMDVTMMQVAGAFSAEINGGTYYLPKTVKGTLLPDGTVKADAPKVVATNVLRPEVSAQMQEMIYQGRHKGFFGKDDPDGYRVGGKTGTSQIIDPKTGKYSDKNSVGSYLGFGGVDQPKYVIMVRVLDSKATGGYEGTTAAGPIFNEMSNWMLNYLELRPKL